MSVSGLTREEQLSLYVGLVGTDEGPCDEWWGGRRHSGKGDGPRGSLRYLGACHTSHKVAHHMATGEWWDGHEWELDHTCENTICVRPAHLERVTQSEHRYRTLARRAERGNPINTRP